MVTSILLLRILLIMTNPNEENVIEIFGEVSPSLALNFGELIDRYTEAGSPPLTVLIDSEGGCVVSGLAIFDSLKNYRGHTIGKVVGGAESMAAIILQACKERRCVKGGHILIHHLRPPFYVLSTFKTDAEEEAYFTELERYNTRVLELLSERTKNDLSLISRQCSTDRRVNPKRALQLNLIDFID